MRGLFGFLLIFLLFPFQGAGNPAVFTPDFSGAPVAVPAGAPLMPLCDDPSSPLCVNQWSQQAIPLAVYPQGAARPQFQYFLPAFLPVGAVDENPAKSADWTVFRPSFSSSFSRRRDRRRNQKSDLKSEKPSPKRVFYRSKSSPDTVKIVETDQKGKKIIREKRGGLSPEEDISQLKVVKDSPEKDTNWEAFSPSFAEPEQEGSDPQTTLYQSKSDPSQFIAVYTDDQGEQKAQSVRPVLVSEEDLTLETDPLEEFEEPESRGSKAGSAKPKKAKAPSPESDKPKKAKVRGSKRQEAPDFSQKSDELKSKTAKDLDSQQTQTTASKSAKKPSGESASLAHAGFLARSRKQAAALPAALKRSQTKSSSASQCISLEDPKEGDTEAGWCFECLRDGEDSVLSSLMQDRAFFSALSGYLKEVTASSRKKISSKEVPAEKICSPETSLKALKAIIKNFEIHCPGDKKFKNCSKKAQCGKFKSFFEKAQCESCKQGVPPEIMMAMMSIESAGICQANLDTSRENSMGLFQINAKVHQCRNDAGKTYSIKAKDKTEKGLARQCFQNPINNLRAGVDILAGHYRKVNAKPTDSSSCKSWRDMGPEEKDAWRRGVSAYNGGPGWVTRAIESVRNTEALKNTGKHLKDSHKHTKKKYAQNKMPWERLRLAYFAEKLSQKVKKGKDCITNEGKEERGTGRLLSCTISNLAHTEAVLGRNVKGSPASMVDIWSLYMSKHKAKCPK